jgi:phage/plasmid-associated DNA primase
MNCNYCDFKCNTEENLNLHFNKEHKEEQEEYDKNNDIIENTDINDDYEETIKNKENDDKKIKARLEELKKIADEAEKREFDQIFNGQKGLADIFVEYNKDKIKLEDTKISNGYYYSEISGLWEKKEKAFFVTKCVEYLERYLVDQLKKYIERPEKDRDTETQKKITFILTKCRTLGFVRDIFDIAKSYLVDVDFCNRVNVGDHTVHLVAFKNGVYDMKEGKLRPFRKEDELSYTLPYNYREEDTKLKKIKQEIKELIKKISNNNDKDLEFNLYWLGYCLTGYTKEQRFLLMVGEKASNGKTTLFEIFEISLPIYTMKFSNKTFNLGNEKSHKQFAMLRGRPIRLVFIEELDEKTQDMASIKDFTGGRKITSEIMYGTMNDNLIIRCKLNLVSNKNVIFKTDKGVERRGLLQEAKSIFMEEKDYKKLPLNRRDGKFIKDKNLLEKFKDDDYKLAFTLLIMEYSKKYITNGFNQELIETPENNFKELCGENDTMKSFIEEFFEITENDKDRIHKDEFTTLYNIKFKSKTKWAVLMSDIKRHLTYDPKAKIKGKSGCILGIKSRLEINNEPEQFGDNIVVVNDSV